MRLELSAWATPPYGGGTRMATECMLSHASMLACDSMHSVAIRVPPPYGGVAHADSSSRIVWAAQAVLRRDGFSQQDAGPLEEVWAWRDPTNPPGLQDRKSV